MNNKKNKDLIIISTSDGEIKLWGLIQKARDKRMQWKFDFEYLNTLKNDLKSPDDKIRKVAEEALIFLNSYVLAEFDNNFTELEIVTNKKLTKNQRKDFYLTANSSKRDLINNNRFGLIEYNPDLDPGHLILSDLHDQHRASKKRKKEKKE